MDTLTPEIFNTHPPNPAPQNLSYENSRSPRLSFLKNKQSSIERTSKILSLTQPKMQT
jgi:hypothetical protein